MTETAKIIIGFSILFITLLMTYVFPFLYFKWGIGKWFFHNVLGWHSPKNDNDVWCDGCSFHCKCKHCGKDIMQDSQGNWF